MPRPACKAEKAHSFQPYSGLCFIPGRRNMDARKLILKAKDIEEMEGNDESIS